LKSSIEFINHASVIIKCGECQILCDPWYEGEAFHKGWNLLIENDPQKINQLLQEITHIWISHEHPDHFSILFFKKYQAIIRERNITILFQSTKDKRVMSYFLSQGLFFNELDPKKFTQLNQNVRITCFKVGFYDSALLVESENEKILNLNDCEIKDADSANQIYKFTGKVDVLLTQFSYAAWKGGRDNLTWRVQAAKEKLQTFQLQVDAFKPKYTIPFASFVYFSNEKNYYLNDSVNTPKDVYEILKDAKTKIIIMKPYDIFNGHINEKSQIDNINFWQEKYKASKDLTLKQFSLVSIEQLTDEFSTYRSRIKKNNNYYFMLLLRFFSPIKVFRPIYIFLEDLNITVNINLFSRKLQQTNHTPHLTMGSESLHFIFKNTFGFDTLTVNGCFEENVKGGFILSTKTLGIENINNIGISFTPLILVNIRLLKIFFLTLTKVAKKISNKN